MHSLALAPALPEGGDVETVVEKISRMSPANRETFWRFINEQGLAGHWYLYLKYSTVKAEWIKEKIAQLRVDIFRQTALVEHQKRVLYEIDSILMDLGIPYLVFKGVHVREILYSTPSIRPTVDIDILVLPKNKNEVVGGLCRNGFSATPDRRTISNDLNMVFGGVIVDLHWDVLRPGRARDGLAEKLIKDRVRFDGYYGPSADSTMFLMLIHPVFRKYVTMPVAKLTRFVDFIKWQEVHSVNWGNIHQLGEKFGLCTATWLTATYLNMLTGEGVPKEFVDRVRPGPVKSKYLSLWLRHNLPTQLQKRPMLIKILFTLAAHDGLSDVWRFIKRKRMVDGQIQNDMIAMHTLIEKSSKKTLMSG